MAQIVVDSNVMRDKARTIKDNAETIKTSYTDMLTELRNVTSRMKSGTFGHDERQICRNAERL